MISNYFLKHLKIIPAYIKLSTKKCIEYKFNMFTNIISMTTVTIVWILFWNLIIGNVKEIAGWKIPALIIFTGFLQLSNAMWQMLWYTVSFTEDITSGRIDMYLVRPMHPLFGLIFQEMQLFSVFGAGTGFAIVIYAVIKYYSLNLIKLTIALSFCLLGVYFIYIICCLSNTLAFWFGNLKTPRSIIISFEVAGQYPINIFNSIIQSFYTFLFPIIFIGTLPAITLTQLTLPHAVYYLIMGLLIAVIWTLFFIIIWNKGLKRYESNGG